MFNQKIKAMECPKCKNEIEITDTTISNINTSRAKAGQHTGNIYYCEQCKTYWLENFLNHSKIEKYDY